MGENRQMGNRKSNNEMFTVDLLKGQGIPPKTGPEGIAIAVVTVAIPIIVAIAMFGFHLRNKAIISIKKQEIVKCQAKIDKLSDAVELQQSLEKEKIVYANSLSEVKSSIKRYTQWSPVLAILVENMPDSVVLTNLEVGQRSVKRKVPKEDDPRKMVEIDVLVKILQLIVSGSPQSNCDQAVKDFRDRLRSSDFLKSKLENISVSQTSETLEGQDVVFYEINCVFKPGV